MGKIRFEKFDHVLLSIPEGAEPLARRFYGEVLGLEEIAGEHPGGALWFRIAGTEIHLGAEPAGPVSRRHPAYVISNLEEAAAYLKEKGVDMHYSTRIAGRERFFIRDPFGNRIELMQYAD